VAREIWSFVFRLFGVDWVILGRVLDIVVDGGIDLENTLWMFGILSLYV
jgi:hypothetical protein